MIQQYSVTAGRDDRPYLDREQKLEKRPPDALRRVVDHLGHLRQELLEERLRKVVVEEVPVWRNSPSSDSDPT